MTPTKRLRDAINRAQMETARILSEGGDTSHLCEAEKHLNAALNAVLNLERDKRNARRV